MSGIKDNITWITATSVEGILRQQMCKERQRRREVKLASKSSNVKRNGFAKSCVGLLRIVECA